MTPELVCRLFYGAHRGPERAVSSIERLIRRHGATAVYGHALTAKREAPAAHPGDDTPLAYLDALCQRDVHRASRAPTVG